MKVQCIYVEGKSKNDQFDTMETWNDYQHPMWKKLQDAAVKAGGHGGMEYVLLWRQIQLLRESLPMDMDVYDAAAWSAVAPLSDSSVASRSTSIDFPDFTRGAWKSLEPLAVMTV